MLNKSFLRSFLIIMLLTAGLLAPASAEINFDFGLPLFNQEEIRFEKSKPSDFNLQLLKKYMTEQQGNMLAQLHAITRWFSLIKLSDAPRREELVKLSTAFFKSASKKDFSAPERLRDIFFNGLLLSVDKSDDPKNLKDQAFEDLLLNSEEKLAQNPDYWIIKAILFHELRNRPNGFFEPMKPEEDLKRALTLIPKTAHYFYVMGQAFRFLGSMDTSMFLAIASYEKASSLDPRNHKLQNSLLGIYMGLHEEHQSRNKPEPFWLEEAVYKKILELSPNNPHALNNLGYLYAEYGVNTKLAQELCQRAVDMAPESPGFRDSLGWAAFKNRDFRKAEEELLKSLEIKKNVYEPHYHLATVYYASENYEKAAEHYEQAIQLRPDSAEALNNLAYLYTERNLNIKRAIEMAETAVQLEKNNASYVDTLGWAYYRNNELDKALTLLLRANQLMAGQGEILLHIGRVYLDQNDFNSAITYLKEAFKADPKLKDPDNTLYLAVRLKAYHSAIADYHSLMGERVEKEKINNILMSIARLYQEEKMYDKAIDMTKLCSDIKAGAKSLDEPLFGSYTLSRAAQKSEVTPEETETSVDTAEEQEKSTVTPAEPEETTEKVPEKSDASTATPDSLFAGLPPASSHPLIISFGPQFFRWASSFVSGAASLADKTITIFVQKSFRPRKSAIIRIETEANSGSSLLALFGNYFSQFSVNQQQGEAPDQCMFTLGKFQIHAMADRNSIYLSSRPLQASATIELMGRILPFTPETFVDVVYDWNNFRKTLPMFLQPFITNPIKPFIRVYTRYSYKNGSLNEFSSVTTGKAENDDFMKRFARQLFAFKLQTQHMGLETTIKVRGDNEIIYISTDFDNISGWLQKRFKLDNLLLQKLLRQLTARTTCFINRFLYSPELENSCPTGGKISVDHLSGLVKCSQHSLTPAIPIILDEHACCSFNRNRLFRILNDKNLNRRYNNSESFETIAKDFAIPPCPTSGTWTLEENGIKCSEHEN